MHKKLRIKTFLTIGLFIVGSCFYAFAKANQTPPKKFKVVLDAGHGGGDGGNSGNGYSEKDIALKIVLAVGKELEKLSDVEVIYTRKTDVFIELWERADIANTANADLFISIHCNAHSSQAKGTETFVLGINGNAKNMAIAKKENSVIFLEENYEKRYEGFDPNKPETTIGLELMQEEYLDQSINLASFVENEFTKTVKRSSRGVKQNIFWVLHRSVMPSVLIETGFLTNNEEGKFLNSTAGQQKMAKAISKAVTNYKNSVQENDGVSIEEIDTTTVSEENPVITTPEVEKSEIYKDITFKVQLAASKNKIDPKPYNFKKLQNISREKEGNLYRYYYEATSDYALARKFLLEAQNAGYKEAFIVSFNKSEIKVPLKQVLN